LEQKILNSPELHPRSNIVLQFIYDKKSFTNYSSESFSIKKNIVRDFLSYINCKTILDLGCNSGEFSIFCSNLHYNIVSVDNDYGSIENLYKQGNSFITPLIVDLTNPSPNMGSSENERDSFSKRMKVDCVLSLALIHHLRISNNIPFDNIARYLSTFGDYLIIEFIPKKDSQIKKMLINREDIFYDYSETNFKKTFENFYNIIKERSIDESDRTMFLMRRKKGGKQ